MQEYEAKIKEESSTSAEKSGKKSKFDTVCLTIDFIRPQILLPAFYSTGKDEILISEGQTTPGVSKEFLQRNQVTTTINHIISYDSYYQLKHSLTNRFSFTTLTDINHSETENNQELTTWLGDVDGNEKRKYWRRSGSHLKSEAWLSTGDHSLPFLNMRWLRDSNWQKIRWATCLVENVLLSVLWIAYHGIWSFTAAHQAQVFIKILRLDNGETPETWQSDALCTECCTRTDFAQTTVRCARYQARAAKQGSTRKLYFTNPVPVVF